MEDKSRDIFTIRKNQVDGFGYTYQQLVGYFQNECQKAWGRKGRRNYFRRGHHEFIPRHPQSVALALASLKHHLWDVYHTSVTYPALKFLDCGCGIGNIMVLAHGQGYQPWGIEFDKNTIEISKQFLPMFGVPTSRVIHGSIATFKHYDEYDVIYAYQPMSNSKKNIVFEHRAITKAKSGTYFTGLEVTHSLGSRSRLTKPYRSDSELFEEAIDLLELVETPLMNDGAMPIGRRK